jgi:cytochrome P450
MAVGTAPASVFDADLPALSYDAAETPADIYPRIEAAQRQAPIALGPYGPEVLSYRLVRSVLRDTRFQIPPGINLFVQGITSGPLWYKVVNSLLCLEGDAHHRLRSLTSKAFTPRATLRLHDTMADLMNELVDRVADAGRCDVVTDIARPYPVPIICALLGAPREDWQQFSLWADEIFKAFSFNVDLRELEPGVMRAWGALDDYVDDMVARRRHSLTDDLLSDLIAPRTTVIASMPPNCACSPEACCWRGRTPPATRWAPRCRSSASTRSSGSYSRRIPNWPCTRSRKPCATHRSHAELFGW